MLFLTIIMTERHPFHTLPRAYTSETPPTHLRDTSVSLDFDLLLSLDMLLYPTEMDIQFVQVLQQCSKGCTLGHLVEDSSGAVTFLNHVLCFYCRLSLILSFKERNLTYSFPSRERFFAFSFL